jgi:hypothetical protein
MRVVDLDPVSRSRDHDPLDADDRTGGAASGTRFERHGLAHRPRLLQAPRLCGNDSCAVATAMVLRSFDDSTRIIIGRSGDPRQSTMG